MGDITFNKHHGNEESNDAYIKALPSMAESRRACYDLIAERPRTAKECAVELGKPFNAVSGRLSELKKMGLVEKTPMRRDGGAVLQVIGEYYDPEEQSEIEQIEVDSGGSSVTAIETFYKGFRFRSRLEARWAVVWVESQIDWEYELQGYNLSNGERYLPDFWLPTFHGGMYVEVKPLAESDISKPKQFVLDSGHPLLLCVGSPACKKYTLLTRKDGLIVESEFQFGSKFRSAVNAARAERFDGSNSGVEEA